MVESNPFFNYSSYVKLLKKLDETQVKRYGGCEFFYDDHNESGVTEIYSGGTFKNPKTNIECRLLNKIKDGKVHLCFPLLYH